MAEERKTTASSEMRNVQLSELTKEFLVAHRMVQEAGDHTLEHQRRRAERLIWRKEHAVEHTGTTGFGLPATCHSHLEILEIR